MTAEFQGGAHMADTRPGILAIFNNVAAGREAEFEAWFQHEHLSERLAVPGFLLGRRHEAVAAEPRYFNFYVTQSADVLTSAAYLTRLDHPTPMTRVVMSEIFKDMIRTVCQQVLRLGVMRGAAAVVVRLRERPDETALQATLEGLMRDKAVACGEVWSAVSAGEVPVSEEERLRGGDRRMAGCLLVETLRVADAERIAAALSTAFPGSAVGVYRLLCEISWYTLAAAIRREADAPRASRPPRPSAEWASTLSRPLVLTLRRALDHAGERDHEYTTLEHLLLALIDDVDAAAVMTACKVDLGALRTDLAGFVDNELKTLVADFDGESNPTPAFQRVMQRAMAHAQGVGRDVVTGADVLLAMFDEKESPAVWFLGEHEMTQQDAANFYPPPDRQGR